MRATNRQLRAATVVPRRGVVARWAPFLIVVAGWAAYATSFRGAFLFDDEPHILTNPALRTLWPLGPILRTERPVLGLTIAANHVFGGPSPWGFHLVNLIVHLLTAMTLYGVVRRSMRGAFGPAAWRDRADGVALATALLFVAHPLTTQGVTYVIQRGESMMAWFYLLTLYAMVRSIESRRPLGWKALAALACALGMGSKPVMVTAPVVALFFDRAFLSGSFRSALRERWGLHLALAATWLVLAPGGTLLSVLGGVGEGSTHVGFGTATVTPWEYARTQPGVILHYLRLAFWPDALCLDYGWPVAATLGEIVPPFMVVGSLALLTILGVASRHPLSFPAFFFFAVLAPTSSFVPIKDLAFDHRMYLPLAAVILLVVVAVRLALDRLTFLSPRAIATVGVGATTVITTTLAVATMERNKVYHSPMAMWTDVLRKRPGNYRAMMQVGNELCREGRYREARDLYRRALELKPLYWDGQYNLGVALEWLGDLDGAESAYREATRLVPLRWPAHEALGRLLTKRGRAREAVAVLDLAARKAEIHAPLWFLLGQAHRAAGDADGALDALRRAARLDDTHTWALIELGNDLRRAGRAAESVPVYQAALLFAPNDGIARLNLGNALAGLGRLPEALVELERAARLEPEMIEAQMSHAEALRTAGRLSEAIDAYRRALALSPNHPGVRAALDELSSSGQGRDEKP